MNGTIRMAPLGAKYREMKVRCMTHWQEQKYINYWSSWVPVSKQNIRSLVPGDLVIDQKGVQTLFDEGRQLDISVNGESGRYTKYRSGGDPVFVWKEPYLKGFSGLFDGNEHYFEYKQFSKAMEELLRKDESPLYHKDIPLELSFNGNLYFRTNMLIAGRMLADGVGFYDARSQSMGGYGEFMRCYLSLSSAARGANSGDAIVRLHPEQPLDLLNYHSVDHCDPMANFIVGSQHSVYYDKVLQLITAEFGMSGLKYYEHIHLYDDLHLLRPETIISIK